MTPDMDRNRPLMLITGSSGLIGTRLSEAFADEFRIVGLGVKEPQQSIDGTDFVECDLTDDNSVSKALDRIAEQLGRRIASAIQLARDGRSARSRRLDGGLDS